MQQNLIGSLCLQSDKPVMEDEIDDSSGSDFDDDEDPDKIQVPG